MNPYPFLVSNHLTVPFSVEKKRADDDEQGTLLSAAVFENKESILFYRERTTDLKVLYTTAVDKSNGCCFHTEKEADKVCSQFAVCCWIFAW